MRLGPDYEKMCEAYPSMKNPEEDIERALSF